MSAPSREPIPLRPLEPIIAPAATADEGTEHETAGRQRPRFTPAVTVNRYIVVLCGLVTGIVFAFLLIEPTPAWLLLLGAAVVILGLDGALRATWREPFTLRSDTTAYLVLPALYVLAAPVLVQHNLPGYWLLLGGLLVSAGFVAIVLAEVASVRTGAPAYPTARLVLTAGAYFVLFALASMAGVFDISLTMTLIALGPLALLLGIEALREHELDPMETLVYAIVTAAVIVQARWLLHYLPLDTYIAGLLLTLIFFVTTGMLHTYIQRQLTLVTAAQYSTIATVGLALIIYARASGLA